MFSGSRNTVLYVLWSGLVFLSVQISLVRILMCMSSDCIFTGSLTRRYNSTSAVDDQAASSLHLEHTSDSMARGILVSGVHFKMHAECCDVRYIFINRR